MFICDEPFTGVNIQGERWKKEDQLIHSSERIGDRQLWQSQIGIEYGRK
jgi:hypothetical protein